LGLFIRLPLVDLTSLNEKPQLKYFGRMETHLLSRKSKTFASLESNRDETLMVSGEQFPTQFPMRQKI
jgi:hypothetical protein